MRKFILFAAGALALASCSNDEAYEPVNGNEHVAVSVVADIAGVKSRAANTAWDTADRIGISCTSATGKTEYANMAYETTGDGIFSHVGGKATGIFFQDKEDVTFTAYYPFSGTEGTAPGIVTGSSEDQSKQKEFDYMFAKDAVGSRSASSISFTGANAFKHSMTRLVITIKVAPETGFSAAEVANGEFALQGMQLNGTFDTASGIAQASDELADTDFWTIPAVAAANNETMVSSVILFPQKVESVKFRAIIDNEEYFATISPALAAGTSYNYTVTIKKQGLVVSSATINDWIDIEGGEVDAEMGEKEDPFNGHDAVLMREATSDTPALYFATTNIGAENEYTPGLYFWWGYTDGHADGSGFYFGSVNPLIQTYNKPAAELTDYLFERDGTFNLRPEKDAAHIHWGGAWRMPTSEEMQWLLNNCTYKKETDPSGMTVHRFTSKTTGGEIILPWVGNLTADYSAGLNKSAEYWTSTSYENDPIKANALTIAGFGPSVRPLVRYNGFNIRPVVTL